MFGAHEQGGRRTDANEEPIAHTRNAAGQRQPLVSHLRNVARLTGNFGASLHATAAASYLGLAHDVGKLDPAFQAYLRRCEEDPTWRGHGPDHKAAGSDLAGQQVGLAALAVQGHHGGLSSAATFRTWLADARKRPEVAQAERDAFALLPELHTRERPSLPRWSEDDPLAAELLLRLIFSTLVDADFLDTEHHFSPERSGRRSRSPSLSELWQRFERSHAHAFAVTVHGDLVAQTRAEVYRACLRAADAPPGVFRLTVPTGGGKTLSGLAFALRHALRNGQHRVIVAVPFLAITEQTADVYRAALETPADAGEVVLEHHSEALWTAGTEDFDAATQWGRLAAENWDAPVTVTTTVQLFESLFAGTPARCRKLHRLAGSVLILDEAQALPPHLLTPILDVLRELVAHYGVSVVLCTATQPAFGAIDAFASVPATEIVREPEHLFRTLRRVRYEWWDTPAAWDAAAAQMRAERQALAIVNTKRDALALLDALDDPDALHLSTALCGAHRRAAIGAVRQRLAEGTACRLVATQVVEAGVDLDFPFVLRAVAPLDSIIQAAGRCNREGRLPEGRVLVFQPAQGGLPGGAYRTATGQTLAVFGAGRFDPDDPATASAYFRALYGLLDTDRERIQQMRRSLDYPAVGRAFQMIEPTDSVVVPYGSSSEQAKVARLLVQIARRDGSARHLFRSLQPYVVAVPPGAATRYADQGLATSIVPGVWRWEGRYDPVRGLVPEGHSLDELVV